MSDRNSPIEALTQSLLAILDLDPVGLSEQDISDEEPECMISIEECGGEFVDTWRNIKSIISEGMGGYEYATSYLDVSDPSERLVIYSEVTDPLSKDCARLKIEYHLSGTIKITSRVNLNTSTKSLRRQDNPHTDTDMMFLCGDSTSITPDQVQASRQQMLSRKGPSDE